MYFSFFIIFFGCCCCCCCCHLFCFAFLFFSYRKFFFISFFKFVSAVPLAATSCRSFHFVRIRSSIAGPPAIRRQSAEWKDRWPCTANSLKVNEENHFLSSIIIINIIIIIITILFLFVGLINFFFQIFNVIFLWKERNQKWHHSRGVLTFIALLPSCCMLRHFSHLNRINPVSVGHFMNSALASVD